MLKDPAQAVERFALISLRNMYHYPPDEVALARRASALLDNNLVRRIVQLCCACSDARCTQPLYKLMLAWLTRALEDFQLRCVRSRAMAF